MSEKNQLPMSEKYALTINEATKYFSIGTKRMRRLAEDHMGEFSVYSGKLMAILWKLQGCSKVFNVYYIT